jgi:hypothetical protein
MIVAERKTIPIIEYKKTQKVLVLDAPVLPSAGGERERLFLRHYE